MIRARANDNDASNDDTLYEATSCTILLMSNEHEHTSTIRVMIRAMSTIMIRSNEHYDNEYEQSIEYEHDNDTSNDTSNTSNDTIRYDATDTSNEYEYDLRAMITIRVI
jgi:hypothetical protein